MTHIVMTYELAMAAGQDAANVQMRQRCARNLKSPRRWTRADHNLSVDVFDRCFFGADATPAQRAAVIEAHLDQQARAAIAKAA